MSDSVESSEEVQHDIARAIDRAGLATGEYEFFDAVRSELAQLRESLAGPDAGGELVEIVEHVRWAFEYRVSFDGPGGRSQFMPWLLGENPDPPPLDDVGAHVLEGWSRLVELITAPPAKARFHHLLFDRRVGNGRDRSRSAAEGYLATRSIWTSRLDRVTLLRLALHVARATSQADLVAAVITAMVDLARESLAEDEHEPGVVLTLTEVLASQPEAPAEVDELLATARLTYMEEWNVDGVLNQQIQRARADDEKVASLHAERVRHWLSVAEAKPGIVRAHFLLKAVEAARESQNKALIEEATTRLQALRLDDLQMAKISTGYSTTRAEVENALRPMLAAATLSAALDAFARFGPITSDAEDNRRMVERMQKDFPLSSLFPHQLMGRDNLPRFVAETEEQQFEYALARHEEMRIQLNSHLIAEALLRIGRAHGIPDEDELARHFARNELIDDAQAYALGRAFLRYWAGDADAAAFTVVPIIESLARNLLLHLDVGIYRAQAAQTPGQYPGLGVLLRLLESRGLDESWFRYIHTLCVNPAGGINLRNEMLHGFVPFVGNVWAALLLHVAAYLASMGIVAQPTTEARPLSGSDAQGEPA